MEDRRGGGQGPVHTQHIARPSIAPEKLRAFGHRFGEIDEERCPAIKTNHGILLIDLKVLSDHLDRDFLQSLS